MIELSFFLPSSRSLTCYLSFLITFWQKWDRFASSFSTSLWIEMSLLSVSIFYFILLFLNSNYSVCLLWYSSSVVSWWFYKMVSLVVVCNYSSFKANRLALVSLILKSISFLSFSVARIFSLSISLNSNYFSFFWFSSVAFSYAISLLYCSCFSSYSINSLTLISRSLIFLSSSFFSSANFSLRF